MFGLSTGPKFALSSGALVEGLVAILEDASVQVEVLSELGRRGKTSRERLAMLEILKASVREAREGSLATLHAAVAQEMHHRQHLSEAKTREASQAARLAQMQQSVQLERKELEKERRERDAVIVQLREAIQEVSGITNVEQQYQKRANKARLESKQKQNEAFQAGLAAEIKRVDAAITDEARAHNAIKDFSARQKAKHEHRIQEWMERHEHDTESKAAELEGLKTKRAADQDKYEELTAYLLAQQQHLESEMLARDKEIESRLQTRALELANRAARVIQTAYRAHLQIKKAQVKRTGSKKRKK